MRWFLTLLLVVFGTLTANAQASGANYTLTSNYGFANNLSNCTTHDCFLVTDTVSGGGTALLTYVGSGYDLTVIGIGTDGSYWNLPLMSSATGQSLWTKMPALGTGPTYDLDVHSSTEIYRLTTPAPGDCANGNLQPQVWNGSAWQQVANFCFTQVSSAADDTFFGVQAQGTIRYTTTPEAASPIWGIVLGNTWAEVHGYSSQLAFARTTAGVLYSINVTANTATTVSGAPSNVTNFAVTADGTLIAHSTVVGNHGGYDYYYTFTSSTPTWTNLDADGTVFGNRMDGIFTIASDETPRHFLNTALIAATSVTGNFNCTEFTGGTCPAGAVHTATATVKFPDELVYNIGTASGAPADNLDATGTAFSEECDPYFGDPGAADCFVEGSGGGGSVICSIMGAIWKGGLALTTPKFEIAYTRTIYLGTYSGCEVEPYGGTWCNFNVDNWCVHNPPDFNMHGAAIHDQLAPAYGFWDVFAACISATGTQPWACALGKAIGFPPTAQLPQANCSYHP